MPEARKLHQYNYGKALACTCQWRDERLFYALEYPFWGRYLLPSRNWSLHRATPQRTIAKLAGPMTCTFLTLVRNLSEPAT